MTILDLLNRGMRSGTVPHTLVVGLGAACEIAMNELEVSEVCVFFKRFVSIFSLFFQYDSQRVSRLSRRLVDGITSQLDHVVRNGDPKETYDGGCG